jgi:molybdopterin-containing oxidoreductase family iron-sulfur binding subunit
MSDAAAFNRRDFLKLVGIGVAGAATGCASRPAEKLIPYLVAPNDLMPGVPTWYASTCRECPAGCGILVKAREGRAIKIEGNPAHPINRGGLCSQGHAALQGLYDPDRLKSPMVRDGATWKAIGWDDAIARIGERLAGARGDSKIALVTGNATGSFQDLAVEWAAAFGGTHLVYEPFSYETVREANQRTFGRRAIPFYDFARAKMVVSFGTDFLETFGSPVRQAKDFAAMRANPEHGTFVAVEPRLSQTGSSADQWLPVRPGGEMALALAMVHVIQSEALGRGGSGADVSAFTPEQAQAQTDIPAATIVELARRFASERPSLAVAGGVATQSAQGVALVAAVNLLNHVAGNVGETLRFDRTLNYDAVAPFNEVQQLGQAMAQGQVEVLVVHGANPVYAVPAWAGIAAAMDRVPFKVAIASSMDETAERCDLVLPSLHALESWGDAEPSPGIHSIQQPTMRPLPMFDARPAGQALIAIAKAAGAGSFPDTWEEYLKAKWRGRITGDFQGGWDAMVARGGTWSAEPGGGNAGATWSGAPVFAAPELESDGDMALVLYPSPNFHDGRGANKPWLQELPDPVTKVAWSTWAEIHPETGKRLGVETGDLVKVETRAGSVTIPAYLYEGIRKDTVAIPLGQGHTSYGRYAKDRGVNALVLLAASQDAASGAVAYLGAKVKLSKGPPNPGIGGIPKLPITQRNKRQGEHPVAQIIPVAALLGGAHSGGHGATPHEEALPSQTRPGKHTEPRLMKPGETIPPHAITAFEPHEKARQARQIPVSEGSYSNPNHRHRWAMAIDVNSCNGCQACVVACYAENMDGGKTDVRFLPMLCQHCSDAPCELVCPVYATYHNPEGLNAQVYNRCVGTRYCSNNCPYKVRAFNWFEYASPERPDTFSFPEPLNWQLNPDVTVRSKGVMEKCTFCVQRILEGKGNARDEDRPLRDGEIQTACSQSCPTQAIVFGDLLDPESQVSKLSHGDRRYWVLEELNTKPAITYLKKFDREGGAA